MNAVAQGIDPGKAITDRLNDVLCKIFLIIIYVTAAATSLVIILAGLKYMTSDDPADTSEAKKRITYAFVGLLIVVVACPTIDYIIAKTDLTPFGKSCKCFPGGAGGTTTTTAIGSYCTDGTPLGQCSTKTAASPTEGMKCVTNAATGNPVLVADPSCPVPSTTTSTSSTTTSSTTTTLACPTADCPNDADSCKGAKDLGICQDVGSLPGIDSICGTGYAACCCNKYGYCC